MSVHFIGAGPGAADLITVRGRDILSRCPVCLYAGSIVPKELLGWCPKDARLVDTAPLSLDEIEAEYVAAHAAGLDVARLHSGDLSMWSAVAEQIRRLEAHSIPYTLTPGVPAFAAAAAALGQPPSELLFFCSSKRNMINSDLELIISFLGRPSIRPKMVISFRNPYFSGPGLGSEGSERPKFQDFLKETSPGRFF